MEQLLLKYLEEEKKLVERNVELILEFEDYKRNSYQSTEIKDLAAALSKAQGEYGTVLYNKANPFFKSGYADLHEIMKTVRPALAKYGLSLIQQTQIANDGVTVLHTRLMHSSGQWIESRNRIIPAKNDPQAYGSTMTYQKRYAAQSLLGITTSDEDDDAEIAQEAYRAPQPQMLKQNSSEK